MNTSYNSALDYPATMYAFKYLDVQMNTLYNSALDYPATMYAF